MNGNDESHQTQHEINWITLKEAARLVGCSVKTVRRRIDSGKWRSIIEYRGRKAIRLVARSDALSETSVLRLREKTINPANALSPSAELSGTLGQILDRTVTEISSEFNRQLRKQRLYLLILTGIGIIALFLFLGFVLPLNPPPYPDIVLDNQQKLIFLIAESALANRKTTGRLSRNLEISTTHLNTLQKDYGRIKIMNADLVSNLKRLEEDLSGVQTEFTSWRTKRNDEFIKLRETILSVSSPEKENEPPESGYQPSPPATVTPPPDRESGFLGIF